MTTNSSFRPEFDWDVDDTFEDTSGCVLDDPGVVVDRGVDDARQLSPPRVSVARFLLDNTSGVYSPANTSGSFYGDLGPGAGCALKLTDMTNDTLFTGVVGEFRPAWGNGTEWVTVEAEGALSKLVDVEVSTELQLGVTTGQALEVLLDEVGVGAADRDIDAGYTLIDVWWLHNRDAYTAAVELLRGEGPGALLYEGKDGKIVFRDRYHRLVDSTSVQAVFRDDFTGATTDFVYSHPSPRFDFGWRDIVNRVEIVSETRQKVEGYLLYQRTDNWTIEPSSTDSILFDTVEPCVAGTYTVEYDLVSGSFTSAPTAGKSAGYKAQQAGVQATAGASGAVVANLKVYGPAYPVTNTETTVLSDSTSVDRYGRRTAPFTFPSWLSQGGAEDFATIYLNRFKDPLGRVTVSVDHVNTDRLDDNLALELGDRVQVVDSDGGLDDEFYVERISHELVGSARHVWSFAGQADGTELVDASSVFILDSTTNGVLGTNVLGY